MSNYIATAIAHPNIAFIKYWGNQGSEWNIPLGNSISMNLAAFETKTTIEFNDKFSSDSLILNKQDASYEALQRTVEFLDKFRSLYHFEGNAKIVSENNFPTGAGIASSASGFAALALACLAASQVEYDEKDVSALARIGSGSASRSVPTGYVEWIQGKNHSDSYSISIADKNHWNLIDTIVMIDSSHKKITSKQGHRIASSSPLQNMRVQHINERIEICRKSILNKDFSTLASISEADTLLMHSVMMSSSPALYYLQPETLAVIETIRDLRENGLETFFTIDAGANVHTITTEKDKEKVINKLQNKFSQFPMRSSNTGNAARLL